MVNHQGDMNVEPKPEIILFHSCEHRLLFM